MFMRINKPTESNSMTSSLLKSTAAVSTISSGTCLRTHSHISSYSCCMFEVFGQVNLMMVISSSYKVLSILQSQHWTINKTIPSYSVLMLLKKNLFLLPELPSIMIQNNLSLIALLALNEKVDFVELSSLKFDFSSYKLICLLIMITCTTDSNCPIFNSCLASSSGMKQCQHNALFPVNAFGWFGYLMIPLGLSFANAAGVSGGFLKVLILMDILNYNSNQATYLSYPIVFGGGLVNFLLLIFKRTPDCDNTLIDYVLVMVLLPTQVFGVVIGNIMTMAVPVIGQDIITILVFSSLSLTYLVQMIIQKKKEKVKEKEKEKEKESEKAQIENQEVDEVKVKHENGLPDRQQQLQMVLVAQKVHFNADQPQLQTKQISGPERPSQIKNQIIIVDTKDKEQIENPYNCFANGITWNCIKVLCIRYKVQYIIYSLTVFAVFETFALLVQGKIAYFTPCNPGYAIGIVCLGGLLICYLMVYYRFIKTTINNQKKQFKRIGLFIKDRSYDIQSKKNYCIAAGSAFIGGFLNGFLGAGVGSVIVLGLLNIGLPSAVASATSGYQSVFTGAASLIQAFANQQLDSQQFEWFFILSVVGSMIGSLILYFVLSKYNLKNMRVIILIVINMLIAIGSIPTIVIDQKYYGWGFLSRVPGFKC